MNILDTIVAHKILEVQANKLQNGIGEFEKSPYFERKSTSLREALLLDTTSGIIAEYKRKSPSKGIINATAQVDDVVPAYEAAGAAGVSILTDQHFFGGKNEDITTVRSRISIPILRKDFVIDEYQILEAKAIGADVILLIAACLSPKNTHALSKFARSLGLDTLLEIHDAEEYHCHIGDHISMVGVNNRNLKTFEVNLETSVQLSDVIDKKFVKIAESGLKKTDDVDLLKKSGYRGFLIGENFMQGNNPGEECKKFVNECRK